MPDFILPESIDAKIVAGALRQTVTNIHARRRRGTLPPFDVERGPVGKGGSGGRWLTANLQAIDPTLILKVSKYLQSPRYLTQFERD